MNVVRVLPSAVALLLVLFGWISKNVQPLHIEAIGDPFTFLQRECIEDDYRCFVQSFDTITETYGPEVALETLQEVYNRGLLSKRIDDHQLAHGIGRSTAKHQGIHAEAFLRCQTVFNYGCQHGFFEYALGEAGSTRDAAEAICGTLGDEYSSKFRFYCYHGVGHGVMMAKAYDLDASLKQCDELPNQTGIDGCWQGVFMENANAAVRGEARSGIFSSDEPLAPCTKVDEQYRHECFINHAGWLMVVFDGDIVRATEACLDAPGTYIGICLESIGLMVSNPVWQPTLLKDSPLPKNSEEIAWTLCQKFPEGYKDRCVFAAVDNIMNFDELSVDRAQLFCTLVDEQFRTSCVARVGLSLRGQSTDINAVRHRCTEFSEKERDCLRGAGL